MVTVKRIETLLLSYYKYTAEKHKIVPAFDLAISGLQWNLASSLSLRLIVHHSTQAALLTTLLCRHAILPMSLFLQRSCPYITVKLSAALVEMIVPLPPVGCNLIPGSRIIFTFL